jgi:hypothetical protein
MISPFSQRRDVAPALHEAVPSWLSTNNAQAQQGEGDQFYVWA